MENISQLLKRAESFHQNLPEMPVPLKPPSGEEIASWIDHTLLKPQAKAEDVKQLCEEARQYGFAAVCVNPLHVPLASGLLKNTSVKVCSVIGFPLGASLPTMKVIETISALSAGAAEIDMVMSVGALKARAYGQVINEIKGVAEVVHNQRGLLKVILEMALLEYKEKIIACVLSKAAGADFVKTSTGFGPGGATLEDVELMRRVVGAEVGVKAAGGIGSYDDAQAMIKAGASRIGASSGAKIVEQASS